VGHNNPYGHPAPSTLQLLRGAGIRTYRTDDQGTVEFVTDGQQVWARSQR